MLAITSAFALVLALYDTFEYACCYNDEKRKTMREWLLRRMQNEADANSIAAMNAGDTVGTANSVTEMTRLIGAEEIAMETFSASSSSTLLMDEHVTQLMDDDDDDDIIELD